MKKPEPGDFVRVRPALRAVYGNLVWFVGTAADARLMVTEHHPMSTRLVRVSTGPNEEWVPWDDLEPAP